MITIGQFWLGIFRGLIDIIGRSIRQFQIEEKQVEFLFLECGDRFLHRANDDAAEPNLLEENLEKALQALVVVDHEHVGWPDLSSFKMSLSSDAFSMRQRPPIWMAGNWPRCTR